MESLIKQWFDKGEKETCDVLVIDDNDEIADLLIMILKSQGYKVKRGKDGVEGLKLAKRLHPSLIMLDITMPKMDGKEVLNAVRIENETKDIPILMCTDHSSFSEVEDCCQEGKAQGYILKPFDKERVLHKVYSILGGNERSKP